MRIDILGQSLEEFKEHLSAALEQDSEKVPEATNNQSVEYMILSRMKKILATDRPLGMDDIRMLEALANIKAALKHAR